MNIPFDYQQINNFEGHISPSQIKVRNSAAYKFWWRSLYQRLLSVIDFNILPDWNMENRALFNHGIFIDGRLAVFNRDDLGLIFQRCTLSGYGVYYQPVNAIVTNPYFDTSLELKIHKDCEILRISDDFRGVGDILSYYAEKLAEMDSALNMNIVNLKLPFIMFGKNKSAINSLKKIMDKIQSGEPAIFADAVLKDDVDSDSPFHFFDRSNVKSNYITNELLRDFQTILNEFDAEVGIPNVPYEKKERMVTDEANSKKADSSARCTGWVNTLNSCFETINEHFGTNMSASYSYEEVESEDENEQSKDNPDRDA